MGLVAGAERILRAMWGGYYTSIVREFTTAGGGEANTGSNEGTGGVGVFDQKDGVNLEFRNINAGSDKVTVTNDSGNKEIDIDVDPSNIPTSELNNDAGFITSIAGEDLQDLGDVVINGPADNEVLAFNNGTSMWINQTAAEAGLGSASDVADNTTHRGSDGSDHSKVGDNETAIGLNTTHRGLTNDPHSVTADQVGLGNVDNTSDADKPVSTDQQTALDLKVDENGAITPETKTKITYDAKGLVTSGADATTADIAASTDKNYVTDAEATVIGNTSNTNTGDQNDHTALSNIGSKSHDTLDSEVGANNAKDTNVTTNLSLGAIDGTTMVVASSDGTDATLISADTDDAGLLTATKFDEIVANNDKVTNANHSGDVTGATELTIATDAVDIPMLSATGTPSSATFLRGDNAWATPAGSGDVSKVGTPADNQVGVWTGDGTIEGTSGLTYDGSNLAVTGTVDGIDIATDVPANTSKETNATHTSEVTGDGALTIADNVVDEANLKVNSPTNDYVLTADDGEAGGMKWAEGGGGSSPLTTKGDLYGYDTEDARLPVGTNNEMLVADSTQTLGVKWTDAIVQGSWTAVSFTNSWVNFHAAYSPAEYIKDSMGFVHLQGLIKNGTVGQSAFTLPVGIRPPLNMIFPAIMNFVPQRVDVNSDGTVKPQSGNNAHCTVNFTWYVGL